MIAWVKWCLIIGKGLILHKSVVEMFGNTYVIYGNVVQKVRGD